jgi:hypothetical protein
MAYTKTTWADGGPPPISAANLNKMEQGIADANAAHAHDGVYAPAAHTSSADHDGRYYTESEVDAALAGKEATGTAASAVSTHEGAADPHTQYVEGTGLTLWTGTQAAYDALTPDASTVYVITS